MAKQDITTVCMICGAENNDPHNVGCVKNMEINKIGKQTKNIRDVVAERFEETYTSHGALKEWDAEKDQNTLTQNIVALLGIHGMHCKFQAYQDASHITKAFESLFTQLVKEVEEREKEETMRAVMSKMRKLVDEPNEAIYLEEIEEALYELDEQTTPPTSDVTNQQT